MDVICEGDSHLLVVTRNGFGKRTLITEYRTQGRYGLGILTLARNEKTGPIVDMRCINADDDVLVITRTGIVLRTSLDQIRETGRSTQGVILMDLAGDDEVIGIAVMERDTSADANGLIASNGNLSEDGTISQNGHVSDDGADPGADAAVS
jgi:DNA gyrase subunit A